MSRAGEASSAGPAGDPAPGRLRAPAPHTFKLRFAAQREPGRSNISAVKPRGLPATVTDKFYRRREAAEVGSDAALRRLRVVLHARPAPTAAHEYGRWWEEGSKISTTKFSDRRLNHHIRDSSWLKSRLLVLATDNKLKQQ